MVLQGKKGMKPRSIKWPEFVGWELEAAKEQLKKKLPGVGFLYFGPGPMPSEETNPNFIVLVIENEKIIRPPTFFAEEPDFSLIGNVVGKDGQEMKKRIEEEIPDVKVVITKDGAGDPEKGVSHILLKVDSNNKVTEKPSYVRVYIPIPVIN